MSALITIRTAIKTTLEAAIDGLWVYDTVADVAMLPAVVVKPTTAEYVVTFGRGTDTYRFTLDVLVAWDEPDLAQRRLDDYVTGAGAKSVRQAIFINKTLGLSDVNAAITGMSGYGIQSEVASLQHLGAVLDLVVHTSGTA